MVREALRLVTGDGQGPCGRHFGIWLAVAVAVGSALTTAVFSGIYVGTMRADLSNFISTQQQYDNQYTQQVAQFGTAISNLAQVTAVLRDQVQSLNSAIAQERVDRQESEKELRERLKR